MASGFQVCDTSDWALPISKVDVPEPDQSSEVASEIEFRYLALPPEEDQLAMKYWTWIVSCWALLMMSKEYLYDQGSQLAVVQSTLLQGIIVGVIVTVGVRVGVRVWVRVGVLVTVGVSDGPSVGVEVTVRVTVTVGVVVLVGVLVRVGVVVGVRVIVGVGVFVKVLVGVGE